MTDRTASPFDMPSVPHHNAQGCFDVVDMSEGFHKAVSPSSQCFPLVFGLQQLELIELEVSPVLNDGE